MEKISLILCLFIISLIAVASGQTSEEARLEYCKDHWREAPDMCADFIPKEHYEEKASKSDLTQEDIKKLDQLEASHFGFVKCPTGSHQKAVSGEKIICVDDNDPRIIVEPLSEQNISFDNVYIIAGIAIVIIIIIIAVIKSSSKPSEVAYTEKEHIERRPFSKATKEKTKEIQHGRCAGCDCYPTHWEFDHIGRRDDNSLENCQGLCRDCHQDKTLRENR